MEENEYKPYYIVLYLDCYDALRELSDQQVGRIINALFTLAVNGEVLDLSDDQAAKVLFIQLRNQMLRDFEKLKKKSENGRKGGAPKGNQNARKHPDSSENNLNQPKKEYKKENEDEEENEDEYEEEYEYEKEKTKYKKNEMKRVTEKEKEDILKGEKVKTQGKSFDPFGGDFSSSDNSYTDKRREELSQRLDNPFYGTPFP